MSEPKRSECNHQWIGSSVLKGMGPDTLFANHNLLVTRNQSYARASVEEVFCKHSLRTCNNANPINFIHRGASLCSLTFNLISYGADVEVTVNDTNRNHYILVLPLSGRATVKNQDEHADLNGGEIVVLEPLSRFRFEMQSDHSHLGIGIHKQRLNILFSKYTQQLGRKWIEFQRKPYLVKDMDSGLLDFLAYICKEIDRQGSIATRGSVAAAIEDTFLTLLVSSLLETDLSRDVARERTPAVPPYLRKAALFMEKNLLEDIDVQDIAEAAGVSERTLYHACQKYHGVSPILWLRTLRLRQARLDLLDPMQFDISVTEVSHRYQQCHVGRFAHAYFQEFGEYPSDTRKK